MNLNLNYIKKMLVSLNILYAISEKPLNLGNKIILEQKQDISAGLSSAGTKRRSQVTGHRSQVTGHRSQVTKCNKKVDTLLGFFCLFICFISGYVTIRHMFGIDYASCCSKSKRTEWRKLHIVLELEELLLSFGCLGRVV